MIRTDRSLSIEAGKLAELSGVHSFRVFAAEGAATFPLIAQVEDGSAAGRVTMLVREGELYTFTNPTRVQLTRAAGAGLYDVDVADAPDDFVMPLPPGSARQYAVERYTFAAGVRAAWSRDLDPPSWARALAIDIAVGPSNFGDYGAGAFGIIDAATGIVYGKNHQGDPGGGGNGNMYINPGASLKRSFCPLVRIGVPQATNSAHWDAGWNAGVLFVSEPMPVVPGVFKYQIRIDDTGVTIPDNPRVLFVRWSA